MPHEQHRDNPHPSRVVPPHDPVFLVGPTAVGKTGVAIEVAERMGAEILSLDSRQIYRHLELGTAKPTASEQARVRHHLIDLYEPSERISAVRVAEDYALATAEVRSRGRKVLAVGGSGLYVDACLGRLDPMPPRSPAHRAEHARIRETEGTPVLHRRLAAVDPESAARLSPHDFVRVSRALEIYAVTGRPMSSLRTRPETLDLSEGPPMVLLVRSRDELYERIEQRARAMLDAGLLQEIERLLAAGLAPDSPAFESIGYSQFAEALRGERSLEGAIEEFIRRTRRYAKRQITWFSNRYRGMRTLTIAPGEEPAATADRVLGLLAEW